MRSVRGRFLILLMLLSSAALLRAETLYLKGTVTVAPDWTFGDLLIKSSSDPDIDRMKLPLDVGGGLLYVKAATLAGFLPADARNLVGRGVWLIEPTLETYVVPEILASIEGLLDDGIDALRISPAAAAKLAGLQPVRGLELRLSSGGERILVAEERRLTASVAVEKVKLAPAPRQVTAGSQVVVRIFRGGLVVEASGRTGRSAAVGETVPVTLNQTRRRVEAVLTSEATAEIFL